MKYMKELINQLANSVPEQTKANLDAKYNFDNDNKMLVEAFAKIGIALKDDNGDYRNTYDILKDVCEKKEIINESDF